MSWWNHDLENPLESQSYRDCMMALAYSILGQPDVKMVETILKSPYILRWPMESNGKGGYKQESKRPRTTYILESCSDLGGSTVNISDLETHIEHPWHLEETKRLLLRAFPLARRAMKEKRLKRVQCAESLVEIMDARRHTVLMPKSARDLFPHDPAKDGFTIRYNDYIVLRRDNMDPVDFAVEDQRTAKRVDDAMSFLKVGTAPRTWTWNTVQPKSGPALGNLTVIITQPETISLVNKPPVTNKDVIYVISQLALGPRQTPRKLQNGWSLYGKRGVVFSGLKADMYCRLVGSETRAIGSVQIPRGKCVRLTNLSLDEFKLLVQQHYGVVY